MLKPIPCPQATGEPCTDPNCRIGLCQIAEAAKDGKRRALYAQFRHTLKQMFAEARLREKGLPLTPANIKAEVSAIEQNPVILAKIEEYARADMERIERGD
jgi:hypothetical protein